MFGAGARRPGVRSRLGPDGSRRGRRRATSRRRGLPTAGGPRIPAAATGSIVVGGADRGHRRRAATGAVRIPALRATRRPWRSSRRGARRRHRCWRALIVFGPARRRLRAVEEAARRLGRRRLHGPGARARRRRSRGGRRRPSTAMADDLAARADALAASDRARRQLLADVSHELTTPVTAMRGYLETLRMPELQLDEATRARYLGIVGDETGAARADHRRSARPGAARRRRRDARV